MNHIFNMYLFAACCYCYGRVQLDLIETSAGFVASAVNLWFWFQVYIVLKSQIE